MCNIRASSIPHFVRSLVHQSPGRRAVLQIACSLDSFTPHVQWEFGVSSNGSCMVHYSPVQAFRLAILSGCVWCSSLMPYAFAAQVKRKRVRREFAPIVCMKQLDVFTRLILDKGFPFKENRQCVQFFL